MEAEASVLDDYVLSLAPAREPRICLLPTAGGDSEEQIRRFSIAFGDRLSEPSHVSLFRLGHRPVSLRDHLLAQDIIYVGGGSMINLIALWRAHGVDEILREAWHAGIVLAGPSAGSMCWFEHGITNSHGHPAPAAGLGFLRGSNSVHYDGEPERRPAYLEAVAAGALPPGYGVDDGVGLLFRGTRLAEAVASHAGPRAPNRTNTSTNSEFASTAATSAPGKDPGSANKPYRPYASLAPAAARVADRAANNHPTGWEGRRTRRSTPTAADATPAVTHTASVPENWNSSRPAAANFRSKTMPSSSMASPKAIVAAAVTLAARTTVGRSVCTTTTRG